MSRSQGARPPIGQLLVRLLRRFRSDLYQRMVEDGSPDDVREVHMQVLGNIDRRGVRLTELATRAGIKPASVSELVDDLEAVGILERRPDPTDGRAKLICLTDRGRSEIRRALGHVAEIEADWGARIGSQRFDDMAEALHELLVSLDGDSDDLDDPGQVT